MSLEFDPIDEVLESLRQGRPIIVTDDANRENEGDLILAAEKTAAETLSFMIRYTSGVICVPMEGSDLDRLELPLMTLRNNEAMRTAYTISVDAKSGVTTGISAADRTRTIRLLSDPATRVAEQHQLKLCSIEQLIAYRRAREKLIVKEQEVNLPTDYGNFRLHLYRSLVDDVHHLALVRGTISATSPTLVRVHSECLTGDVFGSRRCDCGNQLHAALEQIDEAGSGVLVYMRQEGRGIGLAAKIQAYKLQEEGLDTVEANERLGFAGDLREYGIGAQILVDIGVKEIRLLTNNPKKVIGLEGYGLNIVDQLPIKAPANQHNEKYLETTRLKLGHLL